MNFYMALIVTVCAWMTFSVLNQLRRANANCCKEKTCGKGAIATTLWWMNIVVAVLFTIYVLYMVYEKYGNSRNPFKKIKMIFGD